MSDLARQQFLRKDFVTRLKADVGANILQYQRNKPWLAQYAGSQPYELESGLTSRIKLNLHLPDRGARDLKDYENACILFDAFPNLNAAQASDPRLWTHLTHVDCWSYMRQRWPLPDTERLQQHWLKRGLSPSDSEKRADTARIDFVKSHYFVGTSDSRSLTRNGIAGLWWFAKLTYDPVRPNPYELTNILLDRLDVTKNFIERSLGRNQDILRGFLELLAEDQSVVDQVGTGDRGRNSIRALSRRLNAYGGVALLDQLSKADLKDLIRQCLQAINPNESGSSDALADEEADTVLTDSVEN